MDDERRRLENAAAMEYLRRHHGSGRPESWDEFLHRIAREVAAGNLTADEEVSLLDLAVMYCVGRRISERIILDGKLPEREYSMPMSVVEMLGSIREWCGAAMFSRLVNEYRPEDLARAMNENVRPKIHDGRGRLQAAGIVWGEIEQ